MAAENGTLAKDRPITQTPDEVRALVQHWWTKTSETAEFIDACEQTNKDQITLLGADPNKGNAKSQVDDASEITVNHIYRNGIQTVAMSVPETHSVKWSPREMVEPLPGEPVNPQVMQIKRQATGLGNVMGILARRYTEEICFQEKIEAWVQDACHFRMAVLKVMWQGNYAEDQITDERLPDEQDNLARLSYLLEQYHRGEFTKSDWQWEEVRQLMTSTGKVQVAVRTGLVIEEVPIDQFRVDPRVTGPEHVYAAEWMRHDILMSRAEVLSKWKDINPDDLGHAFVYAIDESGKRIKQNAVDKTANQGNAGTRSVDARQADARATHDDDLLLVAEIHDATTNQVMVLVEGLEYPAAQYSPERTVEGFFPFVVLVLNRVPNRLRGFSDTELQAKSQAAANRVMAAGESARRSAQPRFAYDTTQMDAKDAQRIANGEPWEMIPLNLAGKDIRQAIMPLAGNHEYSAAEYDPSIHLENMRRMAALPEQALGVTGVAKFSSEVQTAAAGASILAKYRQARITRALTKLYDMVGQLLLWNVGPDAAVKLAGPLAAQYWPSQPPDRQTIYELLTVKVKVALDGDLDRAKQAENQAKLFQAAAQLGVRVPATSAARLFAHSLGEDEAADLFQPDPNMLVSDLAAALQQGGQAALAPQAIALLAQLGSAAQQQVQQLATQQAMQQQAGQGLPPGMPGGGQPDPSQQTPGQQMPPQPVGAMS